MWDSILTLFPDSWLVYVTFMVTMCAATATILPASTDDSSTAYKIFYTSIQWVALNLGNASNAQDTSLASSSDSASGTSDSSEAS